MALVTLNLIDGRPLTVVRGSIVLPRVGVWHADLTIDTPQPIAGAVELKTGALTLRGFVHRAAVSSAVVRARIAGGNDGMRKTATPRHYTSPILRVVLDDLVKDAGETYSPAIAASLLRTQLLRWTTLSMPVGVALRALLTHAPATTAWRFLPDGSLWLGTDTYPDSGIKDVRELGDNPEDGTVELGLIEPTLLPGTTIAERRIDSVVHVIDADRVRTRAWLAP